ncbi:glycosyltransferase family 4 protein [Candidatus Nomurabacteria bacterium]|nr:glycosyltransferase family 4 protein [Candidatus Nomurabacteria bacterium]
MNILTLGSDTKIFSVHSSTHERSLQYAKLVDTYAVLVPGQADKEQTFENDLKAYSVAKGIGPITLYRLYRRAKQIVHDEKIHVISAQNPFEYALVGYLLKKKCGVRLHIQEHGDFFSQTYWRNERILHFFRYYLGKFLLKKADSIRVVSKKIQKTLVGMGIPQEKIVSIPVFVPLENATLKSRDIARVCVCMIRLVMQKNPLMLLRAWKGVVEEKPDAKLLLVGSGPLKKQIQHAVKGLGIESSVEMHDWTDSPEAFYQKADMNLLSSNYEGWGRVVIEAAAQGIPTVMTDVGCAGEFVQNGVNGVVTPIGDDAAFSRAIIALMEDKSLYQIMKNNLAESLKTLPSQDQTAEKYMESWKKALV